MNTPNDRLEFDSEDVVAWRAFLKTRAGARLFPKWLDSSPALLNGGPTNEILIRCGETRGWSEAAQALMQLAFPAPEIKPQTVGYANLDDDSQWEKELGGSK
jgi:hypothetical protein